ncbi:MAG TPA: tautomerase family protein [Chloroflexota bacterium]|jgi:4-oxalocrotonate tautomerase
MPEVIVELAAGRTVDQKRAIVKGITQVIVDVCNTQASEVTVIIHESPLTDKGKGGVLFADR